MRMNSIVPGAGRTRSIIGVLEWSPKSFWIQSQGLLMSRHLCVLSRAKAEVLESVLVLRVYGIISEKFLLSLKVSDFKVYIVY